MDVYADPITVNCRKVLAGLQLLGVDYALSKVDYFQGEQKSPTYVAINPNAAAGDARRRTDALGIEFHSPICRRQAR